MKQSKKVFFFAAIMLLMISGCGDKSKLLAKTWMVSNLKYTKEIPKQLQPAIDNSVNEMRKSFRITYNTDGTYQTQMNEQSLKGTWKMNWNSSKMTSIASDGSSKDFKIIELTEDKFFFEADEGGEKVIFEMVPAK